LTDEERAAKVQKRRERMARNKTKKQQGGSMIEEKPLKP